ncbi:hypothetical protein GobsT_71540 [Gemmata obscuriglobus]|uniref:Uncharacterized protein n=1 Tax=Gemmata obscuriglobus TaxID=114 RepID=A0A2Z3H7K6_9BACT|nr:hypothetical protein [Gemmata obscuriglobus]AWM41748.1 hypothetical protein C1280_35290 [Gemmata obscuriglobus]QEG32301.1 hypothetical protein GobsT_71540 [Gemmata obscuriglobus]VTS11657.1 unnamed protein product [Gemmata obscuriglobus UQM 2246]
MTRPAPRLSFGKHQGETLAECPPDYVVWLAGSDQVPSVWRELARKHLGLDPVDDGPEPSAESAAVLFPRLLFDWYDLMRREFAGDAAGLGVVDRGFAHLKRICAKVTGRRWPTDQEFAAARAELEREEQERRAGAK